MNILLVQALEYMYEVSSLKKSYSFNRVLFEHYEALYHSYRKSWNLIRTFMIWKRMKHYEREMYLSHPSNAFAKQNKTDHATVSI